MQADHLDLVFQRSASGRVIRWGGGGLSAHHERVLMRFTGYTVLSDLIDPSEREDDVLHIVEDLLAAGYIEPVQLADIPHRDSSWGQLALSVGLSAAH
jgi:hypothetical protein